MEVRELENNFDQALNLLKDNLAGSLNQIETDPKTKEEIVNLWKGYIKQFLKETTELSEEYNNNEIIKAVSRMFIFGR